MKKKNSTIGLPTIILLVLGTFLFLNLIVRSTNVERDNRLANNEFECNDSICVEDIQISTNFDFVYDRFIVFNPDLDSSTVHTFNAVCEHYKLDTTEELLNWCVGQILLESGAKQYYETGHPKEGQLVQSSAGATGISQIMPATAYGNLKKYVTEEDAKEMAELGCTPFDFVNDTTCSYSEGLELSKTWLENETNNIILWGFIARKKLNKRPDILKVLVSYNAGTGGMINYVNSGGILAEHSYVKGIQTKLNYVEKNI